MGYVKKNLTLFYLFDLLRVWINKIEYFGQCNEQLKGKAKALGYFIL